MPQARVAVTGASGFLGRHVLAELRRRKIACVAVTRDARRLAGIRGTTAVVEGDIARPDDLNYQRLGRPESLIHLAWEGLPHYRSSHHIESELPRQIAILQSLLESGLPSLLVTGTCFEYGMRSGCLDENMPTAPDNPYGQAKDALHRELEQLRTRVPFALTWARLFYLYGEGQAPTSLYSQLCQAVAVGKPVFDMSGGEQIRDFLPARIVAGLLVTLALDHPDSGTVNVCSGHPVRILDLVEGWIAENSWSIALNPGHYPYPDYEPMQFWGDRSKLDRLLRGEM
jgi:dTDP-6-deoxy-L-talose 4-dehydrogenase (NAD+)